MGARTGVLGSIAGPRPLLVLALILGLLTVQAGRSTLAFYLTTTTGAPAAFQAGAVDIAGQLTGTGSTPSVLPAMVWSSSGTTNDCATLLGNPAVSTLSQPITPGQFC